MADVAAERAASQAWAERVGYIGCPNPSNPCGPNYERHPPFTLDFDFLSKADAQKLFSLLEEQGCCLWNPLREGPGPRTSPLLLLPPEAQLSAAFQHPAMKYTSHKRNSVSDASDSMDAATTVTGASGGRIPTPCTARVQVHQITQGAQSAKPNAETTFTIITVACALSEPGELLRE